MKFSTRSRYGVRLMLDLARHYEKGPVQLGDISKTEEISEKYLGQIVIQLKSSGLINSVRGAQGGYLLARNPQSITVLDIVQCLEGEIKIIDCLEDKPNCVRNSKCASYEVWRVLNDNIIETLKKYTLIDLIEIDMNKKTNINFSI